MSAVLSACPPCALDQLIVPSDVESVLHASLADMAPKSPHLNAFDAVVRMAVSNAQTEFLRWLLPPKQCKAHERLGRIVDLELAILLNAVETAQTIVDHLGIVTPILGDYLLYTATLDRKAMLRWLMQPGRSIEVDHKKLWEALSTGRCSPARWTYMRAFLAAQTTPRSAARKLLGQRRYYNGINRIIFSFLWPLRPSYYDSAVKRQPSTSDWTKKSS